MMKTGLIEVKVSNPNVTAAMAIPSTLCDNAVAQPRLRAANTACAGSLTETGGPGRVGDAGASCLVML